MVHWEKMNFPYCAEGQRNPLNFLSSSMRERKKAAQKLCSVACLLCICSCCINEPLFPCIFHFLFCTLLDYISLVYMPWHVWMRSRRFVQRNHRPFPQGKQNKCCAMLFCNFWNFMLSVQCSWPWHEFPMPNAVQPFRPQTESICTFSHRKSVRIIKFPLRMFFFYNKTLLKTGKAHVFECKLQFIGISPIFFSQKREFLYIKCIEKIDLKLDHEQTRYAGIH